MEIGISANTATPVMQDFVAELTPYRSLGRQGFVLVMGLIVLSCLYSGAMFFTLGAWPVIVFLIADILIVWLAFKLSYRSGRIREKIYVNREELRVEKYSASGKCKAYRFNPFWTKFEVARHEEFGILSMDLISTENRVNIGSFLNPADREDFSRAFSNALGRAKS